MKKISFNPLYSVAVVNVVTFLAILMLMVLPIALLNMKDTEHDLVDTLSARLSVVAQRSANSIDVLDVASLADPKAILTPPHKRLVSALSRIQREYRVDNAVVYRYDGAQGFVYVADGNDWFDPGAPVTLHERFPATRAAALEAWNTGELGETRLFTSGDSQFYQVNYPLKLEGRVVGLLMLNDDATGLAREISRRNWFILLSALVVIVVEMAVSWALTKHRMRPLLELRQAAVEIASGNFDVDLPHRRGRNEIVLLLGAFGEMVDGLKSQRDKLARSNLELRTQLNELTRESGQKDRNAPG